MERGTGRREYVLSLLWIWAGGKNEREREGKKW